MCMCACARVCICVVFGTKELKSSRFADHILDVKHVTETDLLLKGQSSVTTSGLTHQPLQGFPKETTLARRI